MRSDLSGLLKDAGPQRPIARLDLRKIESGARGVKVRRAAVGGAVLLVATGGGAGAWSLRLEPGPPRVGPASSGDECPVEPYDIALYLRDDMTLNERDELERRLAQDEGVEAVVAYSEEDAYEEFKEIYRTQPEFWENLPRDALPASLRVTLVDGEDPRDVVLRFRDMPGVQELRVAGDDLCAGSESGP